MIIGYARVSTTEQDLALQRDALKQAGCDKVYTDKASGTLRERPGLDKALAALHEGDVLVVWKLDRLGRSLQHLVTVVTRLGEQGIGFRSLTESIDTSTNGGRLVFHIFCALAEFERGLIEERTRAGLEAARAKGHHGGRRRTLTDDQAAAARRMHLAGDSISHIARVLNVSRPVIYRAVAGTHGY